MTRTTNQEPVVSLHIRATAPPAMAPATSWPSAPMFQTLARKHTTRPTEQSSNGVILTHTSAQPLRLSSGEMKKVTRASTGSLPSAAKITAPATTVSRSASAGDSQRRLRAGS